MAPVGAVVVTVLTGGVAAELIGGGAIMNVLWRVTIWASNPANQQTAVALGGLGMSIVDPEPTNDYPGTFDDLARPLKYLFRGTTQGFKGGATAVKHSVTYTSTDPLKSVIFGEVAKKKGSPILLIGDMKNLKDIDIIPSNRLAEMEKEVILRIQPLNFVERAAQLTLKESKSILKEMGIKVPENVNMSNLSETLKNTPDLTEKQIEIFVKKADEIISNNTNGSTTGSN